MSVSSTEDCLQGEHLKGVEFFFCNLGDESLFGGRGPTIQRRSSLLLPLAGFGGGRLKDIDFFALPFRERVAWW